MHLDINRLPETISKENFLFLYANLMQQKNNLSKNTVIQYLNILGEKFEKFYDVNTLNYIEKDEIHKLLKEYTDFDELNLMEDLIGIMFQFRIDKYADYLQCHLNEIESKSVYNEVYDAGNEYNLSR